MGDNVAENYQRWSLTPGARTTGQYPVLDRAVSRQTHTNLQTAAVLDDVPDAAGQVLLGFHNAFPSPIELETYLQGFDQWAIFTMEQPATELYQGDDPKTPFLFDYTDELPDPPPAKVSSAAHARDGAAAGAYIRSTWPYYYRFLAAYDPPLARILAGQPLVPIAPTGGYTAFKPAATRAEMTFRHVRAGGNVLQVGTDRISSGSQLSRIFEEAEKRGTGEVVRIDPAVASAEGQTFLSTGDLVKDLDEFAAVNSKQLDQLRASSAGKNAIRKVQNRLEAIAKSREYVKEFGEGHGVGEIPAPAVSEVGSPAGELTAMRAMNAVRVAGGILILYGVYKSLNRIAKAPRGSRPQVAAREAGGWGGAFAGQWAVGEIFAAAATALEIVAGPAAIITGLIGGIFGGVIGGIAGSLGADWVYSLMNEPDDKRCGEKAVGSFTGGGGRSGGGGAGGSW